MRLPLLVLPVALALSAAGAPAADTTATKLIPITDFAKRPKFSQIQFAPDGQRFAALQDLDGRANLTVGDLVAGKLTRITSFTTYDVRTYNWISNTRLVLDLYDSKKGLAEQRGGGLFAINKDGSEPKELSPTNESCTAKNMICRQIEFLRVIPHSEDEIIATANERDMRTQDVYRLNTRTGRKVLLTEKNPGRINNWVLDTHNVPRAATSVDDDSRTEIFWYRDSADAPWRKIFTAVGDVPRLRPAVFDTDGKLLVFSNLESDKFQLYEFDAQTGKTGKLVAADALADLDTAAFFTPASEDFKVEGMLVHGDKPRAVWFDERYAKLQALMDASLTKGNVNEFRILDDGRVAVASFGDRDPVEYFLYDPSKKQLEEVLRPIDWIKPEQMAAMTPIRYKARDGMEIPAYLTLPPGKTPKNLPLVAVIHGGPFGIRDDWGFNFDVQFLASRGYAVLQPNYRGSGGYGLRHLTSGYKQWGLAMQDDITDGVRSLISQGIVDPARVCIDGGSYGGYATLMALVKEPELFKCGIDEAGVSDLFWLRDIGYSDFNEHDSAASDAFLDVAVGDPSKDKAMLEANSPRLQAAKIKGALMIVHAVRDQRVPFQHAEGMRDAMRAAGKPVEWVVYPDEAHGFVKLENRIDRYTKIEAFLKQNIGQ